MTNTKDSRHAGPPSPGTCRVRCHFAYAEPRRSTDAAAAPGAPLGRRGLRVEPWSPRRSEANHVQAAGAAQSLRLGAAGVASAALMGCAAVPTPQPVQALNFAPVLRMDGGTWTADGAYAAAKEALKQGRTHEALALFERAAIMRPRWDDAVNGQVVALARLDRTAEAIQIASLAVAAGASASELQGNLGLLLLRSGRADEAWASLERAARLDPANGTWAAALARRPTTDTVVAAQAEPVAAVAAAPAATAPPVVAPAATALEPQVQTAVAVVPVNAPVTALVPAPVPGAVIVAAPPRPSPAREPLRAATVAVASPQLRWDLSQPQVMALTTEPRAPVAVAAQTPADAPKPLQLADASLSTPKLKFTIEVSNGAGQAGLAKGTAQALRGKGVQPWRITNHQNFNLAQTEVQYRQADDAPAARQLARKLGVTVALVQNANLHASINLRVVLGKDLASLPAAKRLTAQAQMELFSS